MPVKESAEILTYVSLSSNVPIEGGVADVPVYVALHHGAPVVVFDEAFPPRLGQGWTFRESLLSEILDRIVVCVCQKIMDLLVTSMIFQLIHQARTIAFDLLLGSDCQKNDLCELLSVERSKNTPSKNLALFSG